ncbi:hypothetical protein BIFGAL_03679 [Bifidobacterium gallicum DSM 20093 = LMG 11596]|uniref:Uncharacterized protein n=1 Tax=Bifidobacterium gallicum DSM 20093 = LMG 11596 TaxID=561180 RepID=D1NV01_9BIFI|nr:hypothetical protein BIFGAL_03679 [Bifidobacterium gallicum DSM 20093 = LMG 11596]
MVPAFQACGCSSGCSSNLSFRVCLLRLFVDVAIGFAFLPRVPSHVM